VLEDENDRKSKTKVNCQMKGKNNVRDALENLLKTLKSGTKLVAPESLAYLTHTASLQRKGLENTGVAQLLIFVLFFSFFRTGRATTGYNAT